MVLLPPGPQQTASSTRRRRRRRSNCPQRRSPRGTSGEYCRRSANRPPCIHSCRPCHRVKQARTSHYCTSRRTFRETKTSGAYMPRCGRAPTLPHCRRGWRLALIGIRGAPMNTLADSKILVNYKKTLFKRSLLQRAIQSIDILVSRQMLCRDVPSASWAEV